MPNLPLTKPKIKLKKKKRKKAKTHENTHTYTHLDMVSPPPQVQHEIHVLRGGGLVPDEGADSAEQADEAQELHDPPHFDVRALLQPRALLGGLID